jgi:hypothetical protein
MIDWLQALVAPLNQVVFTLGDNGVTWAELLGFLTGGVCVWLTVRGHIANFGVGIANSAFFLVLFASARLWADASLQIVYIVLGFVGWWQWHAMRRIGGATGSVAKVENVGRRFAAWGTAPRSWTRSPRACRSPRNGCSMPNGCRPGGSGSPLTASTCRCTSAVTWS